MSKKSNPFLLFCNENKKGKTMPLLIKSKIEQKYQFFKENTFKYIKKIKEMHFNIC